jgi:type II secretory pathway component PulJ
MATTTTQSGFTLIEVLLACASPATVMVTVARLPRAAQRTRRRRRPDRVDGRQGPRIRI